ncbi:glycosyl transferase [Cnuibacter physcomitrellae]|uniref:Uncharacterized protein n=1 Tax=Cnuibacter physcomitrellae TaxID=1619308 RepID=A0A1X9LPX9_9MICO|nr:glycosyltransferase family 2 protein [Cnuibacter physcomitrellae]ARJ06001.1 hypothetical protein B5808_12780 [Cnuibacter physcomitrellae]GGI36984.1 glycosyl transferase [Cnuibacter physcomitrellae]
MEGLRVRAVVVNWRRPDLTSAAVASLERQTGLDGVDFGIVVVDNGSGDGSAETLQARHPSAAHVANETNRGFGAAVNSAIRSHPADAYVLLNNDAVADPGFVAALLRGLREPDVGAVTARILLADPYSPVPASAPDTPRTVVDAAGTRWAPDAAGAVLVNSTGNEVTASGNGRDRDWLTPASDARGSDDVFGFSGGGAAIRGAALDEVGLFLESLFMYYEDTELSWRLRRRGWRITYAADAESRHAHAASSGTGSELFRFWNERNRVVVAVRHAPLRVWATALVRTTAKAAAATLRSPRSAEARRRRRSLSAAVRALPGAWAARRRVDRSATVSRAAVAQWLVPDRAKPPAGTPPTRLKSR